VFSLRNKTALVTGAASGIGAAIAEIFAQAGATVWIADQNEAGGRAVSGRIGGKFIPLDVASEKGLCASGANRRRAGYIGQRRRHRPRRFAAQHHLRRPGQLYAVNVRGIFNCCKAFAPAMLERKSGSVINMASIAGVIAVRERLAYTTTKFAVVGLTKALALDHSSTGVRFNCICPGRVETPFVLARLKEYPDPEAAYREMASTQLNGRMLKPEEVAAAALIWPPTNPR